MKIKVLIICLMMPAVLTGCEFFDPARDVEENHILDIIDYLQDMEYEVRVNNIPDPVPSTAVFWQKDSSIATDNIKLEYTDIPGGLAYSAKVTYYESLNQSPVFSVSGTMDFTYDSADNEHKTLKGTFKIADADPEQMPVTELVLDIDLYQSWATGTATANGKEFTLEQDSIR